MQTCASSNIFDCCLQHAAALGLPTPSLDLGHLTSQIDSSLEVHRTYECIHQLNKQCFLYKEYSRAKHIADQHVVQTRVPNLTRASGTAQQILANKDRIADRLRSIKVRPTITVDPAHQPDFSALLLHTAGGQAVLQQGANSLDWALEQDIKPSCWEDHLKAIPDAAKACNEQMQALDSFSHALAALESKQGT
eukprot:jgi/Chrzof1/8694/Cz03g20230.t1